MRIINYLTPLLMVGVVACGPSKAELEAKENAKQDSIASVAFEEYKIKEVDEKASSAKMVANEATNQFALDFNLNNLFTHFNILNQRFTIADITGNSGTMLPGTFGKVAYLPNGFQVNYHAAITPQDVAYQLIGHTILKNPPHGQGNLLQVCNNGSTAPFSEVSIVLSSDSGTLITFTQTINLNIDVTASVKADMDAIAPLIKVKAKDSLLTQLSASLTFAYKHIKNSQSTMTGRYIQCELNPDTLDAFIKNNKYPDCQNWLQSNTGKINTERLFITGVGFMRFKANYADYKIDSTITAIQASLNISKIPVNIGAKISRKVNTQNNLSIPDGFQILAWRTLDYATIQASRHQIN
jgi:hypothetical protein